MQIGEIMYHIILNIPEEVLYDTQMNHEQASQFARLAVAVSYYQNSGVSVGYCAQIAGMNKEDFIKYLGENGISVFHFNDKAEFMEELDNA